MAHAEKSPGGSPDDRLNVWKDHRLLAIELLRIGIGLVWAVNLVFIVAPQNAYFTTFSQVAASFGPSTIGGAGLANWVAANPMIFAWLIALMTAYLAVAFLLGVTVRFACIVGAVFSAVLLGTQIGLTFTLPGGTDVGPHPLYILIYVALVLGGAGQSLSVGRWASEAWARPRLARASRAAPSGTVPSATGVASAGLAPRVYFAYFAAGTILAFGIGLGFIVAFPVAPASTSTAPGPTYYENLTVQINQTNGWPQYSPANFTVPSGRVIFTITDLDSPMNWSGCPCHVTGTVGGKELINGTPTVIVPVVNVAHSFNIPTLGLAIYSPGASIVQFTVDLLTPGHFQWWCMAPCGAGANPYSTPPMGSPGWMTGTLTVS